MRKTTREIVRGRTKKMENLEETKQEPVSMAPQKGPDWKVFWAKHGAAVRLGAIVLLAIFFALDAILLLAGRSRSKKSVEIPEGKSVVALDASATLLGQLEPGDIVTVYDASGKPLEALHYVEVYGTGEDGILLLLDDVQVHALMSKTGCRAALVAHSGAEQLELQERINHPTISLKLPETATVAPGGTVQLDYTATIDPEEATLPAIQWETEDPEIAVITGDGEVQGVALGEVTITATCGTETAQCRLRVEVPLTNMTLSQEEMKLAPGNQGILQAIPEPEDASGFAVTWETSDPTVAEVTEIGVVRGLTEGTAIITARCGQWSASCSVTVRYSASSATLSEHNLTLTEGESVTLTADVQPTIAEDDVISWEIDDPAIATVDENGLVTAIAPGSAIITYRCGLAVAYCVLLVRKAPQ